MQIKSQLVFSSRLIITHVNTDADIIINIRIDMTLGVSVLIGIIFIFLIWRNKMTHRSLYRIMNTAAAAFVRCSS